MADRSVRVRLEAITSNFNRKISESAVLTRQFSRELESADGRMANMVQTGLALAPTLAPLGAAAIPAIAGLTTQLGFAALATGTLVLGLNGVGDALKALDAYQLDPTAEHFKKLQQTLEQLGPAGGEFVLFLDQVEPRLKQLRNLAEQGLLPGAEEGISHLLNLLPQVRDIVFTTSTTLGDLLRDAGNNLDDPRWQKFFGFLQTRARPTLTEMGKTAGNFAEAFTNLVMDFDPLERDFSQGLLHMSQQVRDWSDGLEQDQGFRDLVDYVQKNGPRALDTLGALGEALLKIVEAAAPVGSVALPVLTELLKVVGAVADTPVIGSGLVGLAAAIGIYGRSLALLKTVGLRGSEGVLASTFSGSKTKITEATKALREFTTTQDRSARSAKQLGTGMYLAYGDPRVRAGIKELGKGAALAAGFAVAQSGVADSVGLSNTASLALMGTLAGPWGAAVGGATGFALDLAHANNDVADAIKRADAAAKGTDFAEQRAAMADLIAKNEQYQNIINPLTHPLQGLQQGAFEIGKLFGIDPHGDTERQIEQLKKDLAEVRTGALGLYRVLNGVDPSASLSVSDNSLTEFLTKISPALQRAGMDINDVLRDPSSWTTAQMAVHDWVTEMDSAQGRSKAVGAALAGLQDEITPTVDAAKALSDALDALFGPALTQADAIDKWIGGLHDLRKTLGETKDVLTGSSADALKNREAIRSSVKDLEDRVKADAAAGVSGDKLVQTLLKGRDAIIAQAVAAGKSRPEVEKYLDTLGLTPDNLVTVISTPGLLTAKQQVEALGKLYRLTPAEVRTLISQLNMDHSQAAISRLAREYNLTPKQVQTLVRLLGADPALSQIHELSAAMAALRDKTVMVKVHTVYDATHNNALGGIHTYAQGDVANRHMPELAGPGPTRIWREPETRGEAYIPLANDFRRPRAVDIWEKTGIALGVQFQRFAMGGFSGAGAGVEIDYNQLAAAVNGNRLLAHRDTRDALLSAFRTALRETPVQRVQQDPSLLYGAS